MAELVYKDCRIYHGGYDLSAKHSEMSITLKAEMKDRTTFTASSRQRKAGLTEAELSGSGFWDISDLDSVLFDGVGVDDGVLTVCPTDGTQGETAFIMKAVDGEYVPGESIGELLAFNFAAYSQTPLVRAVVMETGAKTSTADGTARQMSSGVLATQKMYAALHCTAVSGTDTPTISVALYSNSSDTWDGSETLRHTFTDITEIGAQMAEISGAITDTWWRAEWTITGTDPSLTITLSLGIK